MGIRQYLLVIAILFMPVFAFGQSYEWLERIESAPGSGDPFAELSTRPEQVSATDYGIYAVGRSDCAETCKGFLAKYRAEDGKLLWKRKFTVFAPVARTEAFALAVNALGVFVVGRAEDLTVPPATRHHGSYVRLYDHDGNTVWTAREEQRVHELWDIELDDDSVYVIGTKLGIEQRAVVRRLAFDGATLWTRTFGGKTDGGYFLELGDGRVYAKAGNDKIFVMRANDGALLTHYPVEQTVSQVDMLYASGFLYLIDQRKAVKYAVDGTKVWRFVFFDAGLPAGPSAVALVEDGLLLATVRVPNRSEPDIGGGSALITLGFDGVIRDEVDFPGSDPEILSLDVKDGATYATGLTYAYWASSYSVYDGYTARYSDRDLLPPSILTLAAATPAAPPRLAVLHHDYGAGPVVAYVLDASPGSFASALKFSADLKAVAFDRVADLNGNGFEELVVVSRAPPMVEIRDSLDGSLVSTFKVGNHLEPLVATVEERPGTAPRLAIAARQPAKDTSLLQIYNLANGNLLASNNYNAGFDAIDVAALPPVGGGSERRYALLGRNRVPGEPHKIELRAGNGNLLENLWIGSELEPLELDITAGGVDGLSVLRHDASPSVASPRRLDVHRIDLASRDRLTVRYYQGLIPVTMLELPDTDGNGFPEYAIFGGIAYEKVETQSRDIGTGEHQYNLFSGKYYRPQDATYIGSIPNVSDNAFGLLGYRRLEREFKVTVAGSAGAKLFDLYFLASPEP